MTDIDYIQTAQKQERKLRLPYNSDSKLNLSKENLYQSQNQQFNHNEFFQPSNQHSNSQQQQKHNSSVQVLSTPITRKRTLKQSSNNSIIQSNNSLPQIVPNQNSSFLHKKSSINNINSTEEMQQQQSSMILSPAINKPKLQSNTARNVLQKLINQQQLKQNQSESVLQKWGENSYQPSDSLIQENSNSKGVRLLRKKLKNFTTEPKEETEQKLKQYSNYIDIDTVREGIKNLKKTEEVEKEKYVQSQRILKASNKEFLQKLSKLYVNSSLDQEGMENINNNNINNNSLLDGGSIQNNQSSFSNFRAMLKNGGPNNGQQKQIKTIFSQNQSCCQINTDQNPILSPKVSNPQISLMNKKSNIIQQTFKDLNNSVESPLKQPKQQQQQMQSQSQQQLSANQFQVQNLSIKRKSRKNLTQRTPQINQNSVDSTTDLSNQQNFNEKNEPIPQTTQQKFKLNLQNVKGYMQTEPSQNYNNNGNNGNSESFLSDYNNISSGESLKGCLKMPSPHVNVSTYVKQKKSVFFQRYTKVIDPRTGAVCKERIKTEGDVNTNQNNGVKLRKSFYEKSLFKQKFD